MPALCAEFYHCGDFTLAERCRDLHHVLIVSSLSPAYQICRSPTTQEAVCIA
jgi:hypothetical protein